jgi:tRNA A-37 threonylcarbamoyl transferase component Bud32/tetratricopeptide (TPR) repeat protein
MGLSTPVLRSETPSITRRPRQVTRMDDSRRERLKESLLILEGLSPGERRAWIFLRLADDPELAAEATKLMGAQIDDVLAPLVAPPESVGLTALLPRQIGPFVVEGLIAQGGMGNVYRAHQEVPVRRRAAVKVLRAEFSSHQLLSRFEDERRAIAKMEHRNIARFLEAGTDELGRSYIAMELVDGLPVTEYAALHNLSVRQRLEIFLQICRGVQHAHNRGILHRDIKPSNILVADEDTQPVPKVIDFGVAKLHASDLSRAGHTLAGQLLGTLGYMSPEQSDPKHPDSDVRSDVYSLGVVLYELLTKTQLIPTESLKGLDAGQVHHRLLQLRPTPPSRIDQTSRAEQQSRSSNGMVPRELDCLVLKAIEPDRDRRYADVGDLIADVERYLGGHPILARPQALSYRFKKFIWRHRWPTAFAMLACVGLLAVAVSLALGYRNTLRQRDRAERAAATFEQTSTLLRKYLLTPRAGFNGSFGEIVGRGADDFLASLPQSPTVRGRVAQSLGESLFHAGDNARARRLMEVAVAGFEDPAFEADTGPMRDSLRFLSLCRLAALEQRDGNDVEAIERYRAATRLSATLPEHDLPMLWTASASLGSALGGRGEFEEAISLLDGALAQARDKRSGESLVALLRGARAGVLGQMERFDEAIAEGEAVLALRSGPDDKSTPYTIMLAIRHGSTLLRAGEPAKAAEHLHKTLDMSEKAFGINHAQTLTIRRLLAEAVGVAAQDQEQLSVLDDLLAKQPTAKTREALSIRKSRVAVLAAQGSAQQAITEARELLTEVDTPSGDCTREGAMMRVDLARALRIAAPDTAKELASAALEVLANDLGVESVAASIARKLAGAS